MKVKQQFGLDNRSVNRIIEMAWEDRTTFEAIEFQFGVSESDVIRLMREVMRLSSWKMWRKRVQGRATKHASKRTFTRGRHKSSPQRAISQNKISKRYL